MHRIDSPNARPDQNGTGKAGFNDNGDLSGQDPTYLTPDWCNDIQENIALVVEENEPLVKGNKTQLKDALYSIFATGAALTEADDRLSAAIVALSALLPAAISTAVAAEATLRQNKDNELQASVVRPGSIVIWPLSTAPVGYLECAGQSVSRATYASLFETIGTSYGVGDGSTTFTLPDLRAEFVRGWDHDRGIDAGRTIGSTQAASSVFMGDPGVTDGAIPSLYNMTDDNPDTLRTALKGEVSTADPTNIKVLSIPHTTDDPATVANTTMSVRPRNVAMMYIIKI